MPEQNRILCRELSLLAFNRRVLAQAQDTKVPLLERLRFLCIVSSNLDEFFEVRMAWLKRENKLRPHQPLDNGKTAAETIEAVAKEAQALIREQYDLFNKVLQPALSRAGIHFYRRHKWTAAQKKWIENYFDNELLPILTPIGLDPSHPFPRPLNKSLNFAVELEGTDAFGRPSGMAIVQAPRILPRVVPMPSEICGGDAGFVFLSSILHAHVGKLFPGMKVKDCHQFRLTRDSDLTVDEEDLKNLRAAIQNELHDREYGDGVRLEVADTCPAHIHDFLLAQFKLTSAELYQVKGPVNLVRLNAVPDLVDRPDLKFPPRNAGRLKACLKQIPENVKSGELCVSIAEKYERLGLYAEAVKWVKTHYPQNRQPELLEAFVESVRFLSERDQQKAIDLADSWLQEQPDNALLLMYLGQLAYGRKLWGKAQGYLEASIALQPSVSAHLVLARVFDETDQPQKAQEQRNLVLESVAEEEHPTALPQPN